MSEEYRDIIKRLARIAELLERKERDKREAEEDIAALVDEAKALNTDLLTLHLGGDSER
jgi:hypothetical protein